MPIIRVAQAVEHWLSENCIPTNEITVVIRCKTHVLNDQIRRALSREFQGLVYIPDYKCKGFTERMTINGIKFAVTDLDRSVHWEPKA
jgi:hypothetical protein